MLDLDNLAERCARTSNEEEETWRHVIWGADFQKVTQFLTDGEVELLLTNCPCASACEQLIRFLANHPDMGARSPMEIMGLEAGRAGVSMSDWIQSLNQG